MDNIVEILDWLRPRMKDYETRDLFVELDLKSFDDIKQNFHLPHIQERIKLEIRRKRTANDVQFKVDINSRPEPLRSPKHQKTRYTGSFIDKSSKDD